VKWKTLQRHYAGMAATISTPITVDTATTTMAHVSIAMGLRQAKHVVGLLVVTMGLHQAKHVVGLLVVVVITG